ncbi:MAG: hypothetical protein ABH858_00930, partial [Candidatus Omnitrophota bacterium]
MKRRRRNRPIVIPLKTMIRENTKQILLAAILLFLAIAFSYLNSLPNAFVFDDNHMIVANRYIKDFKFLPEFFKERISSEPIAKGMYRPLLMITFSLNYFIGGLKPHAYHLVN